MSESNLFCLFELDFYPFGSVSFLLRYSHSMFFLTFAFNFKFSFYG